MVKRIDIGAAANRLNEQDVSAVLTRALASDRTRSKDNLVTDDLIVSLADAHENRRAQQVTEWVKRQHFWRAGR